MHTWLHLFTLAVEPLGESKTTGRLSAIRREQGNWLAVVRSRYGSFSHPAARPPVKRFRRPDYVRDRL